MKKHLITSVLFFASSVYIYAQSEEGHNIESKGENPVIELIASGIYAYSFEHKEGVVGTELHLTYWFTHEWGGGLSYTAKFEEEETLHDIALLGSWNPTRWTTLNLGPNFGLAGEHREFELSAYVEAEINIRPTEWFHFGPVIGTVLGKNTELSTGIHLGFEF